MSLLFLRSAFGSTVAFVDTVGVLLHDTPVASPVEKNAAVFSDTMKYPSSDRIADIDSLPTAISARDSGQIGAVITTKDSTIDFDSLAVDRIKKVQKATYAPIKRRKTRIKPVIAITPLYKGLTREQDRDASQIVHFAYAGEWEKVELYLQNLQKLEMSQHLPLRT